MKKPQLFFLLITLLLISCIDKVNFILTQGQKIELADKKFAGLDNLLQGSVEAMQLLDEVIALNPNHCEAIRELSIAYLKRGMPHEWKPIIDRAVACDPATWQGHRGYLYLYFYRDYNKAIEDFNETDSLTPNYIDAPQGHSVDFWRGHAYFGLKKYSKAIEYYEKHIATVTENDGEDWVEINAFLYLGVAYYESQLMDKALR